MDEQTEVYKIPYSKNTTLAGVALALLVSIPLVLVLTLGGEGPIYYLVTISALLVLLPGFIIYLTLKARNMSYEITKNEIKINFFTNTSIPFTFIKNVEKINLTLLLRLFGGSWPGLHWGLFKTSQGNAQVYATKIHGSFILITLIDGKKVAITPAEPEAFLERIFAEQDSFEKATAKMIKQSAAYSKKLVYAQIVIVTGAFLAFLGYLLWVYPSLPETVPMHFSLNWTPDHWAHKSELFIMAALAAVFPAINGVLVLKFGKYEKALIVFLGIVFVLVEILFLSIIQGILGFI